MIKNINADKTLNEISKENKINILVYKNENEICPKCGNILNNKIIDEIILSNNNVNYSLTGMKIQIEHIMNDVMNKKDINYINSQLNNISLAINNINENIKKINNQLNQIKYNPIKKDGYKTDLNLLEENINFKESTIIKEDERNIIISEIESRMNKKIKQIKKLYQATKDGGDPEIFHLKCNEIHNTLVFVKSEGQRRFGGFTPIPWKSEGEYIEDPEMKTFVFSLDNNKIYNLKENHKCYATYHNKKRGPCFGIGHDIGISGNPINDNKLYTCKCSYDYKEDNQFLSEYDEKNFIHLKALEYEVFQIILN